MLKDCGEVDWRGVCIGAWAQSGQTVTWSPTLSSQAPASAAAGIRCLFDRGTDPAGARQQMLSLLCPCELVCLLLLLQTGG